MKLPILLRFVFNRVFFQKVAAILLFVLAFYALQGFMVFFLATFLFAYLFLHAGEFLSQRARSGLARFRSPALRRALAPLTSVNAMVLVCYLIFIGFVVFAVSDLVPRVMQELKDLPAQFPFVKEQVDQVTAQLQEIRRLNQDLSGTIEAIATEKNFNLLSNVLGNLKTFGSALLQLLVALILSYVFIVDRARIVSYFETIKGGNFSFLYREYANIFGKIGRAFGMIFKAQAAISFVNTVLTAAGLLAIGGVYGYLSAKGGFPYLFTLSIVVFVLGFVPVLGFLLSSIPLLIVGFLYGGINVTLAIVAMVAVVHALEAYFLNPRIVSSYAQIPMSLSFLILFLSEHAFGLVGLLIGVPLYYLAVDLLKDFNEYVNGLRVVYGHIAAAQDGARDAISREIRVSRSGKRGPDAPGGELPDGR
jgi:predicted PurR-regulated permease PerM